MCIRDRYPRVHRCHTHTHTHTHTHRCCIPPYNERESIHSLLCMCVSVRSCNRLSFWPHQVSNALPFSFGGRQRNAIEASNKLIAMVKCQHVLAAHAQVLFLRNKSYHITEMKSNKNCCFLLLCFVSFLLTHLLFLLNLPLLLLLLNFLKFSQ